MNLTLITLAEVSGGGVIGLILWWMVRKAMGAPTYSDPVEAGVMTINEARDIRDKEDADYREALESLADPGELVDGYYWFKCERASRRSVAQYVRGQWYCVNEVGPIELSELLRRGWELDYRIYDKEEW